MCLSKIYLVPDEKKDLIRRALGLWPYSRKTNLVRIVLWPTEGK